MRNVAYLNHTNNPFSESGQTLAVRTRQPRKIIIGLMLVLALFAFEMFNFDTTRYALESFLGEVRFAGLGWAVILAVAFCAIDFAGLARLFTSEGGADEPKEIYYLTGAWLLGATMNAVMTWWAVSLTLLNHDLGNEVLSREQLLTIVPMFVAALVWLTRILFIGALTVAGERMLHPASTASSDQSIPKSNLRPVRLRANGPANRSRGRAKESLEAIDLSQPPAQANNHVNSRVHHSIAS
ncbi:MAG: hypothetical protein BMS9Abin02_0229 [Anaerolineae bacterium]|nr:MAG: hypothetical protein BMS9Abin02_0229 [Anaerolineae bacterium]